MKTKLQEKLESFGIPNRVITMPSNSEIFTMENYADRKKIRIRCPRDLELSVSGSKKLNQAVLNFTEPEDEREETISIFVGGSNAKEDQKKIKDMGSRKVRKLIDEGRVFVKGSTFTINGLDISGNGYVYAKITVKDPARDNCFLIGKDEKHTFICQLQEKVSCVTKAHEALRPDVSEDSIRVGEWFFEPVDDEEAAKIFKAEDDNGWMEWNCSENTIQFKLPNNMHFTDINSDNHSAQFVFYHNDDVYVMGCIRDVRRSHKEIVLPRLHRVVRNMEMINESETWD